MTAIKVAKHVRVEDGIERYLALFGIEAAARARAYHETYPEYAPTELVRLDHLADHLGIERFWVKDESSRFGLNAFKVLGGTYCIGSLLMRKMGREGEEMTFDKVSSEDTRRALGEVVFATTTDGNHGRGIAWTAARLGYRSIIRMPKGTRPERLENIRKLGADASITDLNYDETSFALRELAQERGWMLVQDSAWEGYEEVPTQIMQGYLTMGAEILEQLGGERPTHVFLQAGVGSMAAALAAFFRDSFRDDPPFTVIVEPDRADCLYQTARAADGELHIVGGALDSMMAGLACGVPSTLAWEVLERCADAFVSMPDWVAANGMRVLGAPLLGDKRVISGESGAATSGLVASALATAGLREVAEQLHLDAGSRVLCISTEGATDTENYRRVVWEGLCPMP